MSSKYFILFIKNLKKKNKKEIFTNLTKRAIKYKFQLFANRYFIVN